MFIKQIIANNADIIPDYENKTLAVGLDGLSAPGFNTAAQLLNETETVFRGSDIRLIFETAVAASICER